MGDRSKTDGKKPGLGETQSDSTAEKNKPDDARAKGDPKAGNILASVQKKS